MATIKSKANSSNANIPPMRPYQGSASYDLYAAGTNFSEILSAVTNCRMDPTQIFAQSSRAKQAVFLSA